MFPIIAWRPIAAAFTIASIVVYTWLGGLFSAAHHRAAHHPAIQPLLPIPKQIWQINFEHPLYDQLGSAIDSWPHLNPNHTRTILTEAAGRDLIRELYADDPQRMNSYLELKSRILRSDYLRYLVLAAVGGVYSDLDTDAIKPIDQWIPPDLAERGVRAMVGIETDSTGLDAEGNPKPISGTYMPVQFAQWTLACSARHPMMVQMAEATTTALHRLASSHGVPMNELEPKEDVEVLFTTGPVQWSRTVFSYLSEVSGTEVTYKNLTGMRRPKVFGDVMVLPIAGFTSGAGHSGSPVGVNEDTLLWHQFQGTWRAGAKDSKWKGRLMHQTRMPQTGEEKVKEEMVKASQGRRRRPGDGGR
ncbi:MAG: hypothetical protein Q9173_007155 [Seirophora scorigena]